MESCERSLELEETLFGRQVSRIAEFRAESRFISPAARKFTFIRPLKRGCVFLQAFRGGRKIVGKTEDGETQVAWAIFSRALKFHGVAVVLATNVFQLASTFR